MAEQLNKVIVVSGPTATGKTALSLALAQKYSQCEIVNFDSLCFYRELTIGTAKPTDEELSMAPHHLVNISSIKDDLNASDYCKLAITAIEQLHQQNKIPILTGGSGFYLRALIKGMYDDNEESKHRDYVETLYRDEGITPILTYLKEHDPDSLNNLHENDHYRLGRAMEFHLNTGKAISKQKEEFDQSKPYDFSQNDHNWDIHHLYLDIEKEKHWELIKERTKKMIALGLVDEVKALLDQGYSPELKPLQSIGYKQVLEYLITENQNQEELIESIYIATRRLAKSQRTFFKKITPKYNYNPLDGFDTILNKGLPWPI